MLKLFFVFTVYIYGTYGFDKNYCEICPNHTLCKYEISGPSSTCIEYDYNALLTENDINAIVDQINRRRNFIALGHSNFLPGAANMKKLVRILEVVVTIFLFSLSVPFLKGFNKIWSRELAISAQRWVDQCDQILRPDREDQCRDLEHMNVGQNIATITGPSSSLNVKSFVEIWFMQSLVYNGSVTYYNESLGNKSNQFTQLIWANTEKIGCGKAKFIVNNFKTTIAERLVCNFAQKGNIHGKPVYIIGYAATQCSDNMQPDSFFPGLCSRKDQTNEIFNTKKASSGVIISSTPVATSLLRIRNLFNDSTVNEIDPVYSNLKLMENETNKECLQINKKSSSIVSQDIFFDAVKRSNPLNNEHFWINYKNNSYDNYNFHQHDKGHSRVYHGHEHKNQFDSIRSENDFTTTLPTYKEQDYRKHNINPQCTRNMKSMVFNPTISQCIPCKQKILKCTRKQKKISQIVTAVCEDQEWQTIARTYPNEFCRCNNLPTTCPSVNRCIKNTNCECVSIGCPFKACPNMLRALGHTINSNMEKRNDFHYYDIFSATTPNKGGKILQIGQQEEKPAAYENFKNNYNHKIKLKGRREYDPYYRQLFKRSIPEDDLNYKPFWQIDDYTNKKKQQQKSIRYTTLGNRKNKKSKTTKRTSKMVFKTEHITLKFNNEQKSNSNRVTEKYLSFDELMHLRKFNTGNYSGRRLLDTKPSNNEGIKLLRESDTTKSTQSTEYTANTPFIRMKHCTRKLTCTWTAASLTDSAGSIISGEAGNIGSRTPPGYVEGCTRTSTCTRDYMNRNKMATLHIETTTPEFDTGDDEDYCERRSLNRRNSNESTLIKINENITSNENSLNISAIDEVHHVSVSFDGCICDNNNIRNKRNHLNQNSGKETLLNYRNIKREKNNGQNIYERNILSYGDLFYYVLNKIFNNLKSKNSLCVKNNCLCNNTNTVNYLNLLTYLSLFLCVCHYLFML